MDSDKGVMPYRQDLPPPGGYRAFEWNKVPLRPTWRHYTYYMAWAFATGIGYAGYKLERRLEGILALEEQDAKLASEPLLVAERDRFLLRQCRINRAEEERVMKDVPGWQVGKYFDEPIFYTTPPDMWIEPNTYSLWTHAPYDRYYRHVYSHFYC